MKSEHERVFVVVVRVFPDDVYCLPYEERELTIRTKILPHPEFNDDGYDHDQGLNHNYLLPDLDDHVDDSTEG